MDVSLPISLAAVALTAAGCVGAGAAVLAAAGRLDAMTRPEAVAWSYALGLGVVGWVVFFFAVAGWIAPPVLGALSALAACGLVLLRRCRAGAPDAGGGAPDPVRLLLVAALALVLGVDLMEGLSPPADADSLAYHFALPRQFLAAGQLEFVPRAVDGAIPLLVHMTHMVALALGGEHGLTLWVMLGGWMAGLLVYVVAARHMSRNWALATALLFLSTPAMLYSGGTGQVEPRLALFALAAAVAMADGVARRDARAIALAGLAAGFFAASKYTGLLFVAASAVPLLVRRPSLRLLGVYAAAALVAGFQWYGWNWWHTGDPVFPALWRFLSLPDGTIWSMAQDSHFHALYSRVENAYPRTPLWLLAYPFAATLHPAAAIEAGRTGLGPYGLLVLPFALAVLWRRRARIVAHPLFAVGLICAGFYVLWFFSGVSQRVRHLLPVYPLLLVCLTAAAARFGTGAALRRPVATAAVAALALHLAGQAVFGLGYARHLLSGEGRAAFLLRNVAAYSVVAPVEAAMGPGDRVLISLRQLVYLFDKPIFYYHHIDEAAVTPRIAGREPARFLRQLRDYHITMLLAPAPDEGVSPNELTRAAVILAQRGCATAVRRLSATVIGSRTLRPAAHVETAMLLYRLKEDGCRL